MGAGGGVIQFIVKQVKHWLTGWIIKAIVFTQNVLEIFPLHRKLSNFYDIACKYTPKKNGKNKCINWLFQTQQKLVIAQKWFSFQCQHTHLTINDNLYVKIQATTS